MSLSVSRKILSWKTWHALSVWGCMCSKAPFPLLPPTTTVGLSPAVWGLVTWDLSGTHSQAHRGRAWGGTSPALSLVGREFPVAATTNCQKLGANNNRYLSCHSSGGQKPMLPPAAPGETLFLASSSFWGLLHSLACGHITLLSASIFTPPFPEFAFSSVGLLWGYLSLDWGPSQIIQNVRFLSRSLT